MEDQYYSRRKFIDKCVRKGSFLIGGVLLLSSCDTNTSGDESNEVKRTGAKKSCDDLSGISEAELKKRESLGYVAKTPNPENYCGNCSLYIPPKEGEKCGGCLLFKGPVDYDGHCVQWAAITETR